jgi:hypothetical protein
LASAVLLAIAGSHDAAEAAMLEDSMHACSPRTAPFTSNTSMRSCWTGLWHTTHEPRYRERALAWAKANQKLSPWFAWPFALEAQRPRRKRIVHAAYVFAAFLDRDSHWLSEVEGGRLNRRPAIRSRTRSASRPLVRRPDRSARLTSCGNQLKRVGRITNVDVTRHRLFTSRAISCVEAATEGVRRSLQIHRWQDVSNLNCKLRNRNSQPWESNERSVTNTLERRIHPNDPQSSR